MLDVITAFFLLIFHSIVYLFSSGETKQIAKNHIKEIVNSPDGVIILIVAAALLIGGYIYYQYDFRYLSLKRIRKLIVHI
ncbi:hypothetical protein JFU18_29035 [Bacillus sp. TH22]|uniref:hypothetical protein n=1 Tax=Bacillus sp. TH22 TaxID=2796388 RepID=UPI001912253F|nr:hypothetical protein [Bacillus sp. TH22]MBK5452476.1 hypothetical protein [Bacillus sp. TH22]